MMSARLQAMAPDNAPNPIQRCAPTGAAAFNIRGSTIHTFLSIPVGGKFALLQGQPLTTLQNKLDGVMYIIVDEKSMVSLKLLYQIDSRLRQACPRRKDQPFGGFSLLLFGDFFQLTPVGQKPLFHTKLKSEDEVNGQQSYYSIDQTTTLQTIVRQAGTKQAAFRDCLQALRLGQGHVEIQHWELLASRIVSVLSDDKVRKFQHATRLYFTRKDVERINNYSLRDISHAVLAIHALHDSPASADTDEKDVQNLQAILKVSVGSRVMLIANL
ncbi:unnamed protein product [Zymoseptoria tritici ST99CH_1E4]|uniref:ATP-dependent DNA helicase n=1 Tax=Zymoseptoria tritici ST99CH_1E4 TaxID=1276532 RepID=A0A2H1FYT9_ZYMTR|nr:unnamed protein product [Zymoseptoria tritici ST99CH_1E4]